MSSIFNFWKTEHMAKAKVFQGTRPEAHPFVVEQRDCLKPQYRVSWISEALAVHTGCAVVQLKGSWKNWEPALLAAVKELRMAVVLSPVQPGTTLNMACKCTSAPQCITAVIGSFRTKVVDADEAGNYFTKEHAGVTSQTLNASKFLIW